MIANVYLGSLAFLSYNTLDTQYYSLEQTGNYQLPMMTKEHGIEFYVKSLIQFDWKYPLGTPARADIEKAIINDYVNKVTKFWASEIERVSKLVTTTTET